MKAVYHTMYWNRPQCGYPLFLLPAAKINHTVKLLPVVEKEPLSETEPTWSDTTSSLDSWSAMEEYEFLDAFLSESSESLEMEAAAATDPLFLLP